jgi:hypothetical protein
LAFSQNRFVECKLALAVVGHARHETLADAVRARFDGQPPHAVFQEGGDRVEVWGYDHFDAWETLDWPEFVCYAEPCFRRFPQNCRANSRQIAIEPVTCYYLDAIGILPLKCRKSNQRSQKSTE